MSFGQEFTRTLAATAGRLGVTLTADMKAIEAYSQVQMVRLAAAVDEPGYDQALEAAGLAVALRAAGEAVDRADAIDRELVGVAIGLLGMGARALV